MNFFFGICLGLFGLRPHMHLWHLSISYLICLFRRGCKEASELGGVQHIVNTLLRELSSKHLPHTSMSSAATLQVKNCSSCFTGSLKYFKRIASVLQRFTWFTSNLWNFQGPYPVLSTNSLFGRGLVVPVVWLYPKERCGWCGDVWASYSRLPGHVRWSLKYEILYMQIQ